MKYAASTNGIYRQGVNYQDLPNDLVTLNDQQVADIENALAKGLRIAPGEKGFPIICAQPSLTTEDLIDMQIKMQTDELRYASDQMAPLLYLESIQQLTASEAKKLSQFRQYSVEISRVQQQPGWPNNIAWPVRPC
ncbi:tail fiber assembly protein [Aeromonas hydrophila]